MPNFSILSIAAYYGVVLGAHIYSMRILKRAEKQSGKKVYGNSNPRGASQKDHLQKTLPPKTFARWERARAAHNNGLENFPLFAAAVLAASQGGLTEGYQNGFAGVGVGLRVLYTFVYVNADSEGKSYVRTLVFFAGMGAAVFTIVKAGLTVAGIWD